MTSTSNELKPTPKSKILTAALFLFNRFGFVNVRLQHIADEAEISVGNLAYHFNTKDDILIALYEPIVIQKQQLLNDLCQVPLFTNIDRYLQDTFALQLQVSFFFTDALEVTRAFPAIRRTHRQHLRWQIEQVEMLLDSGVARGAFHSPQLPDTIALVAARFVMLGEMYLSFAHQTNETRTPVDSKAYQQIAWSLLAPYFTVSGLIEYQTLTIV